MQTIERSINLTVNPLTNPQGMVRGGLVVLEDISQEKRMKSMMYRYMTPGVAERVGNRDCYRSGGEVLRDTYRYGAKRGRPREP